MKKIFLILFAVLCAATAAVAQEATVKNFAADPMDLTAQQYARLDKHGDKCALVKVSVVAPGVIFQGNVMGDVQKRGSEYWVYLTAGTKIVRISADSFLTFMYNFPEPLQGGVTYVLTLQAPQHYTIASSPADPYAADIPITKEYEVFKEPSNGKYGYKHNGNIVIAAKFDYAADFSEGLAHVYINGKWGFINKKGALVIPAKYEGAWEFSGGLAPVYINGKWGYVDKNGILVIPAKFDDASWFIESMGLARVMINDKYGFIDKSGTLVIPAIYEDVGDYSDKGAIEVCLNDRWFYIDRNGNELP